MLVCYAAHKLVFADFDGVMGEFPVQPPELTELASAGGQLVGLDPERLWFWKEGRWTEGRLLPGPVYRLSTSGREAVLWWPGKDPGTVSGAWVVRANGTVEEVDAPTALSRYHSPFLLGAVAPKPEGLTGVLASGIAPWGGRILSVQTGLNGDLPTGELRYWREGASETLRYQGQILELHQGLGVHDGHLLLDGRPFGAGLLRMDPTGIHPVPGVEPPCAGL